MIEAIIIDAAILGGIYALLALGFTLIYGVSGVVNLAHGVFFMLGAFMYSVFVPLGVIPALILAAIFVGVVGSIVYRLVIHPVIEDEVATMVVTIATALIFAQLMYIAFGFSAPVPSFLKGSTIIWGVTVPYSKLLAFAFSLGLFASLGIFITKTKIGSAMRAISQDREVAMLMGINTERLYMLTMAMSTAFATVAGVFFFTSFGGGATPLMWLPALFISFSVVILGGLGNVKGSFVGGFIIAYASKFVEEIVPEGGQIVSAVPLVVIVIILLIRPKGLFGKRVEMEE